MDQIKSFEMYTNFIQLLAHAESGAFPIIEMVKKDDDYNKCLTLISNLLKDDGYKSLISIPGWHAIQTFVSDCRYHIPNITEEQFWFCDQMISEINECIYQVQELEKKSSYLTSLYQTLFETFRPKKRKILKAEIAQVMLQLVEYYNTAMLYALEIDGVRINHDVFINRNGHCLNLTQSLVNEMILLDMLKKENLGVEAIDYVIQSPLTPFAMVRVLNFVALEESEKELFINVIDAAYNYIVKKEGKITYKDKTYVVINTEQTNDYSGIIENDDYKRLYCYIKAIPYQESKEHKKVKKR